MDLETTGAVSVLTALATLIYKLAGGPFPQFRRNGNGNGNGSYTRGCKVVGFSSDDARRQVESWAYEAPRTAGSLAKVQEAQTEVLREMRDTLIEMRATAKAEREAALDSMIRHARSSREL